MPHTPQEHAVATRVGLLNPPVSLYVSMVLLDMDNQSLPAPAVSSPVLCFCTNPQVQTPARIAKAVVPSHTVLQQMLRGSEFFASFMEWLCSLQACMWLATQYV